jgi:hypothetical protein
MDIIPIQASSVPCERVFSSGKQTMAPRRSRISAHLMECLQILKFSIRKGRPLRFTEGMAWDVELKEFEAIARTAPIGEAEAYGRSLGVDEEGSDDDDDIQAFEELVAELEAEIEETQDEGSQEIQEDDDDIYL